MKQAVLYVGHGSRLPKACEAASAFIRKCQSHIKAEIQEISFLELAFPSIEEGYDRCVKRGAEHISVIPLLLLTAAHYKKDIPELLKACKKKHPTVTTHYGKPIGVHEKMADSVINKINEVSKIDSSLTVALIGRGSSDPEVKQDLEYIAKMVHSKTAVEDVWTCFLTATTPSFKETLHKSIKTRRKVIFIPYLLFTGVLMKGIEKEIQNEKSKPMLGGYLGEDPLVAEAFIERINESMKVGECYAASND
jgi:sirohydrochlorin ferrochelatase